MGKRSDGRTLTAWLRSGEAMTGWQQAALVARMSLPAVLAQLTTILMEYIDAAMAGSLGAQASASIGLVVSTTWLFGGLSAAASVGFSIQAAQQLGAGAVDEARYTLRQAILVTTCFSLALTLLGVLLSSSLPAWLGGEAGLQADASRYFLIYMCSLPAFQLENLAGAMLQSSGNMRTPALLNTLMCLLDIFWNFFLIFPSRNLDVWGTVLWLPGAGMGVAGAALGTALAEVLTALLMLWAVGRGSSVLPVSLSDSWQISWKCLSRAAHLALPVGAEHLMMCGAMVAVTKIVAPLGAAAIAANSFAVTAESLCYMPGYGIAAAAAPLIGQSAGAGRLELIRKFARLTVGLGMLVMSIMAVLMYVMAPWVFALLTPDFAVRELGVQALRIELFSEPLFAASIVAAGALRGAGDTLVPGIMNMASIWLVRIPLSLWLVQYHGLAGVWLAMGIELCCRGLFMLVRLYRERWLKQMKIMT